MLVHTVFSHADMAKLVAKDYHIATQPFHRFCKSGNRVFDCLCQLSNGGFQFMKQSVVCFDLSVYLAAVRDDSLPFQRTGENALMNGWLLVQSPFCMAAVVNAFFMSVPFQITIRCICPRLAPLDKLFFAVPTLGDIPFGLLFNFQSTMKRSFTYSHWENSNSNPKRKNIFEFENPSHLFGITSLNDTLFHRKNEKIFFIRLREFYFSCPEKPFHLFPLGATKCTP